MARPIPAAQDLIFGQYLDFTSSMVAVVTQQSQKHERQRMDWPVLWNLAKRDLCGMSYTVPGEVFLNDGTGTFSKKLSIFLIM